MDDLAAEDNPTILLSAETESDDPPLVHGEDDPVDEPESPVPLIGQLLYYRCPTQVKRQHRNVLCH